jgi:lysozyme family protein
MPAYHCEADYEYWRERKKTFKPVARTVLIKRPVYQSSQVQRDLPWLWHIERRETSISLKDWEENSVPMQYSGATFKRGNWGKHAIDWCSAYGLTSWYIGHSVDTVTTVDTNDLLRKLTKINLKKLGTEFYEQKFLDTDCDKYTVVDAVKQIDWSIYDTIRLGSNSYEKIYDTVGEQFKDDCKIVVYKPQHDFIHKLYKDGWLWIENSKGVDYFAKD